MMQENIDPREALSAFLDGEPTGDHSKFIARRLEHDAAMTEQLGRWQFAGDVLRKSVTATADVDLLGSIKEKLAAEAQSSETFIPAGQARRKPARVWLGGLAMAAVLSIVAITVRPDLNKQVAPADTSSEAVASTSNDIADSESNTAAMATESNVAESLPTQVQTPTASVARVANATEATPAVRPWRVPADTDALIASTTVASKPTATAKEPVPSPRAAATVRQVAGIATVPRAIKRADDVERVLRGKSEQGVLGVDAAAHPGWPRSVIPGNDGAFNASFNMGTPSSFGQGQNPDGQQP